MFDIPVQGACMATVADLCRTIVQREHNHWAITHLRRARRDDTESTKSTIGMMTAFH